MPRRRALKLVEGPVQIGVYEDEDGGVHVEVCEVS